MSKHKQQKHDKPAQADQAQSPVQPQADAREATASAGAVKSDPSPQPNEARQVEAQDMVLDREVAAAVLSTIEALRTIVAGLQAQRDAITLQIAELDAQYAKEQKDKAAEHARLLSQELREQAARHESDREKETIKRTEELAEIRRRREQGIDDELAAERARRMTALAEEIAAARAREHEKLDSELAARRSSVEKDSDAIKASRLREVEAREAAVAAREQAVADAHTQASALARKAAGELAIARQDQEAADARVPEAIASATKSIRQQLDAKERELEREIARAAAADEELAHLRELKRSFGEQPERILAERNELVRSEQKLREELASRPTKQECEKLAGEKTLLDARVKQLERGQSELLKLQAEKETWSRTASELEQVARMRDVAEQRRKALEGQLEVLTVEVNKLRSLHERPRERDARIAEIHRAEIVARKPGDAPSSELDWLRRIEKDCARSGIQFPLRLLHSFHASLKSSQWSPLTVLSGVSGTGKSILPKLYSRFGGINFLMVPVQPNWDSPQSVFGFFNSVDNRFNATPLLRLLSQSARAESKDAGLKDQMTIILLDEMNLAHVELYFSDMLSKLEDRRGDSRVPHLEIDIGADAPRERIPLEPNVLWCGTMNEDETTKTLSDKVLDRGNMLVFPRPTQLLRRTNATLGAESAPLPRAAWERWVAGRVPFEAKEVAPFKGILEEISANMEPVGRAIGHRVWQSVEDYMATHPLVRVAHAARSDALEEMMHIAFEDQVVLKVMPKLRGIETRGEARDKCLNGIARIVDEHLAGLTQDFQAALDNSADSFMWRSAGYLAHYPTVERIAELENEATA
jgi:hypothetical protein